MPNPPELFGYRQPQPLQKGCTVWIFTFGLGAEKCGYDYAKKPGRIRLIP